MDIIRLGDSTSHGGTVLEAFNQTDLNGKPMSGVGHKVVYPLCKGVFPITQGSALLDQSSDGSVRESSNASSAVTRRGRTCQGWLALR